MRPTILGSLLLTCACAADPGADVASSVSALETPPDGVPSLPRYIAVGGEALPVVTDLRAFDPLYALQREVPTDDGRFVEILVPERDHAEWMRVPLHDQTYQQVDSTTYEVYVGAGMCQDVTYTWTRTWYRRAHLIYQVYDVYTRNLSLWEWYQVVSDYGDLAVDIATDEVIDEFRDAVLDDPTLSLGIDAAEVCEDGVQGPEDVLDVLDLVGDALEQCGLEDNPVSECATMLKASIVTWGLALDGTTAAAEALGLIPCSDEHQGKRFVMHGIFYQPWTRWVGYELPEAMETITRSEPYECPRAQAPATPASREGESGASGASDGAVTRDGRASGE